jgi:L-iditol 2-dehydrogenase
VRVGAALTCGTDLKVFRRGYHARMIVPPALFGHELAGTVVEAGEGVTDFAPGDRVVALNSAPCGQVLLLRARPGKSLRRSALQQRRLCRVHPHSRAHRRQEHAHVPDHVPLEHAALTEPLACAVHGFEDSRPRPATRGRHRRRPAGADDSARGRAGRLRNHRHRQARRPGGSGAATGRGPRGADHQHSQGHRETRALTPKDRGVDIAIEAVGVPEAWQEAVELVRKGGTVNFFGGCAVGTHVTLDTNRIHYSDITLRATFHHTPAICRKALELIAGGRFQAGPSSPATLTSTNSTASLRS